MNAPWLDTLLFGYYPYICLTVFLLGSLIRFDRDQYTWKSDSSQMLRAGNLRWGSNLFHVGILFLLAGHTVGMPLEASGSASSTSEQAGSMINSNRTTCSGSSNTGPPNNGSSASPTIGTCTAKR